MVSNTKLRIVVHQFSSIVHDFDINFHSIQFNAFQLFVQIIHAVFQSKYQIVITENAPVFERECLTNFMCGWWLLLCNRMNEFKLFINETTVINYKCLSPFQPQCLGIPKSQRVNEHGG